MKPFERYANGLPPTPGYFATVQTVDKRGTAIRIGDIVQDDVDRRQGVVVGLFDTLIVYLIDHPTADDFGYYAGWHDDCLVVGHAYNVLREVARIESLAHAARGQP